MISSEPFGWRRGDAGADDDVLVGLRAAKKWLPCRLFYDARGARLFEKICTVPEYYLTRSELALFETHLASIAADVGPRARVIEPGSGAGTKTRMLLGALDRPAVYVPIDVSSEQLDIEARALRREHPGLHVEPVHGDYMGTLHMPRTSAAHARTVVFFPGSTIGNFEPDGAREFLSRFGDLAGEGAMLVLGADSNQDGESLRKAYDDAGGVTAAFNLNALTHLNRSHKATFAARCRIEMQLVSQRKQTVRVGDITVSFERGEVIVTEHCYKHRPEALAALIGDAGWTVRRVLADPFGRMRLWVADRA
jgi:dimethylhistidine N-methyltransferase